MLRTLKYSTKSSVGFCHNNNEVLLTPTAQPSTCETRNSHPSSWEWVF